MNGVYDASAPPPDDIPTAADDLRRLRREAASSRLQAAMDRVDDLAAAFAESEEDDDPVDGDTVALLHALTHEESAPLEWRSLGRRVDAGLTTWSAYWRRPQDEVGGIALLGAVMRADVARAQSALEEEPPTEHDPQR